MSKNEPTFRRKLNNRLWWLGICNETSIDGEPFHLHLGLFLLLGDNATMLIDTGTPTFWEEISKHLDVALGGRTLDYCFPTHPEVAHCSALPLIMKKYPDAKVLADSRDFHLYFPEIAHRVIDKKPGDELDLGGMPFVFLPALMKDLPNTLWGYERSQQVMYVSDGFSVAHSGTAFPEHEDILHRPGECDRTSSELTGGVDVEKASYLLRAALYWSRFVDDALLFKHIEKLFLDYPTKVIAPAHGNVIDDLDNVLPVFRTVQKRAFQSAMAGQYAETGDFRQALMAKDARTAAAQHR